MRKEQDKMKIIARIETDFPEKFGIPRQSRLSGCRGRIVFEREYRNPEAFRGIEEYSHLWIVWKFSKAVRETWSPTVRPPRLGGNRRVGVFATRSPYRPNPIGLSCVSLERLAYEAEGPVLYVSGIDMMDGTPIYDIKPYLPYVDSIPEAKGGFSEQVKEYALQVEWSEHCQSVVSEEERENLNSILSQDPRPSYQDDPDRVYGMEYAGMEIRFQIRGKQLTVIQVERLM